MLSLTSFLLAVPLLAQGRVVQIDGTVIQGTITAATVEGVSLRVDGSDQTIPPGQVLRLHFGPPPPMVAQAAAAASRLEFQNAANLYAEAATTGGDAWVTPFAQLGRAEALLGWASFDRGHAPEAVSAFREWTASHPDHFWIPRARMGLAQALALEGKVEDAANEMQDLANFAFEKNLGKRVEFEARLTRSRVYLTADQAALARQRLEGSGGLVAALKQASVDAASPPALRASLRQQWQSAQILLGDTIESIDGLEGAQRYWERILRTETGLGADARAAGQIAMANAARAQGKLREAQFALAEIAAVLNTGPDTAARTLYSLGEVCAELGDKPTPGKVYFQRVIDLYPSSTWASQARKKLGQ